MDAIIVHTKKDCVGCLMAKEFLANNDAYFICKEANAKELFSLGFRSLPVIEYKGEYLDNPTIMKLTQLVQNQKKDMEA